MTFVESLITEAIMDICTDDRLIPDEPWKPPIDITEWENDVLLAIAYLAEPDRCPRIYELCEYLVCGKGTVHEALLSLRKKGLVTWEPRKGGTLRIVSQDI